MQQRHLAFRNVQPRNWLRGGAVLACLAAMALLASAFSGTIHAGAFFSVLLALVLVALLAAVALHVRFLLLARRDHYQTATALYATEQEYKSVFDNALDAILILDDRGVCLEANPAASTLLGINADALVGHSIERFFAGDAFKTAWTEFLSCTHENTQAQMLRGDGRTLFVEYTIKTNFLPGRHVSVLRDITERREAETALKESEERFQQIANHITEIFWIFDSRQMRLLYVNPAYETVTGRSLQSLNEGARAFEAIVHPEDQDRVLVQWRKVAQTGRFDEEFRIVRPDDSVLWVWVHGFPIRDADGSVCYFTGTAQDISARKLAEEQMILNLGMAESARAEAEALRNTSLALTQDLSMDHVLDTLLESLLKLVPCESARVLLLEDRTLFFTAREMQKAGGAQPKAAQTLTFDAKNNQLLMRVLATQTAVLLSDTCTEPDWRLFPGHSHFRSWLCVPLVAAQRILGLLSVGHAQSGAFSGEHLRLAKSLAIPAAVAIQNARLYERAEIYSAELEQRLADLQQAREALQEAEQAAHFRRRDS